MASRTTALAALLLAAPGCVAGGPGGVLRAEALGDHAVYLQRRYVTAFFADHDDTETSLYLSDLPLDVLVTGDFEEGQVVHLDLLWAPLAGTTPMDSSATNVTIRYVVFADGEVGVYGGAGFAVPEDGRGGERLTVALKDASLALLEATEGFADLLTPARLTGRVTAARDADRTRQIRFAVSQLVTNRLGRTRLVRRGPAKWPCTNVHGPFCSTFYSLGRTESRTAIYPPCSIPSIWTRR